MQSASQHKSNTSPLARCWRAQLDAAGAHPGQTAVHCCRWPCQGAGAAAAWQAAGLPRELRCPAGCPLGPPQLLVAAVLGAGAWEGAPRCPSAEPSFLVQGSPGKDRSVSVADQQDIRMHDLTCMLSLISADEGPNLCLTRRAKALCLEYSMPAVRHQYTDAASISNISAAFGGRDLQRHLTIPAEEAAQPSEQRLKPTQCMARRPGDKAKHKYIAVATGTCDRLAWPSEPAGRGAAAGEACLARSGSGLQEASCSSRLLSRRVAWQRLHVPNSSSPSASCSALGMPSSLLST